MKMEHSTHSGTTSQSCQIHLEKNWWILILTFFPCGALVSWISWELIRSAAKTTVQGASSPTDWSTWLAIYLLLTPCSIAVCWEPVIQYFTDFTTEGVSRPKLIGRKVVLWKDVVSVTGVPQRGEDGTSNGWSLIQMKTIEQSITLNSLFYKYPDELIRIIQQHAPKHAQWLQ